MTYRKRRTFIEIIPENIEPRFRHHTNNRGNARLGEVQPGFHWKWPWQRVYRISIATGTLNMAYDPESPEANHGATILEAVTKEQLNIGLDGQIRYRVAESNLCAYIFGLSTPKELPGCGNVEALFTILETQKLIDGKSKVTLVPKNSGLLTDLMASRDAVPST